MRAIALSTTFDRENPNFDIALELLAILPPENGIPAKLLTLAADICDGDEKVLTKLIHQLRDRGYTITTGQGAVRNEGRVAYIPTDAWPQAKADAEAYLAAMSEPTQAMEEAA